MITLEFTSFSNSIEFRGGKLPAIGHHPVCITINYFLIILLKW
jgi:hypothetical protein